MGGCGGIGDVLGLTGWVPTRDPTRCGLGLTPMALRRENRQPSMKKGRQRREDIPGILAIRPLSSDRPQGSGLFGGWQWQMLPAELRMQTAADLTASRFSDRDAS